MSILLKNATIITQDRERKIRHADVYLENDTIVEIGAIKTEADVVIKNRLVIPGLINMHTHLPMTLLRGYCDDLPLNEWLHSKIWPAEARLKSNHVRIGTKLALLEMAASGTTCCADMYFFEDVIAEEAQHFGMRCYAGFSIIDFDTPELKKDELLPACERFVKKWHGDTLVTPVVAPHSTYSCAPETLERTAELAQKYDVLLHTHCAETRDEIYDVMKRYNTRPLAQLEQHGLLGPNTILAHCGWITKEEVKTIATTGACVVHNPVSNMKLATGGYTPLPELFEASANVALGTDGAASNNTLNMLETMKFAAVLHKHHRWDATAVTAQETLDMATVNAARFLDLNTGSVEEGKKADIVCVDLQAPNLQPQHNLVSHIVYAANTCNISDVIINGKMIVHERKFVDIDAHTIYMEAEKAKCDLVG